MFATSENFYDSLPVFDDFLDITDPARFSPLPDDWYVVASDVQGSTGTIARGGYKDVNVAGASTIIAVLNIDRSLPIPFIFGGDGATLCIPPSWAARSRERLLGTVGMVRDAFGLTLRAGIVPVAYIRSRGCDVRVARHRVSGTFVQAIFTGGGAQFAEDVIKTDAGKEFLLKDGDAEAVFDFSGLECRWNDIPSLHGEIVSLIVKAFPSDAERSRRIYRDLIIRIREIYGSDRECRPIHPSALSMSVFGANPRREIRVRTAGARRSRRWTYALSMRWNIVAGKILIAFNHATSATDWGAYPAELAAQTDSRKFSDLFRQVLSGTASQKEELASYLEGEFGKGSLAFGMHASPTALLTCLVFSYSGAHLHLVDGGNGGYTLAAVDFKKRWKAGAARG
jgi:hypothetical protein